MFSRKPQPNVNALDKVPNANLGVYPKARLHSCLHTHGVVHPEHSESPAFSLTPEVHRFEAYLDPLHASYVRDGQWRKPRGKGRGSPFWRDESGKQFLCHKVFPERWDNSVFSGLRQYEHEAKLRAYHEQQQIYNEDNIEPTVLDDFYVPWDPARNIETDKLLIGFRPGGSSDQIVKQLRNCSILFLL